MTTLPPSRAKVIAISLPIPLAAPVMTATLSFKRMGHSYRILVRTGQIVQHHLAETERQGGDKMAGGNHPAHGQAGDVAHRMLEKLDGRGPGPGAFQRDGLEIIPHELADPGRAIHMRDDLDHEAGLS